MHTSMSINETTKTVSHFLMKDKTEGYLNILFSAIMRFWVLYIHHAIDFKVIRFKRFCCL